MTAFLSCEPAENFGTLAAAICTGSPVRGFTPWRAARRVTWNLPKPVNVMESPLRSVLDHTEGRVDCRAGVALCEAGLVGDGIHELLLGHVRSSLVDGLKLPARAYRSDGFGSTMRVHPLLPRCKQFARTVERGESHAEPCESVGAALLTVDNAHGMSDDEPGREGPPPPRRARRQT